MVVEQGSYKDNDNNFSCVTEDKRYFTWFQTLDEELHVIIVC